ncbi:MAG: hypothetical protein AAF512_01350 [Pseudomonadota bacterium]
MSQVFAVVGSRGLPASFAPLVARVCRALVARSHRFPCGASLAVGCASGADSFAVAAVPASAIRVFAVAPCLASASPRLRGPLSRPGLAVVWGAGGGSSVPPRATLARRTRAVVAAASAGCVAFLSSPDSPGSLLACRAAADRGLRVVVFPCGFVGSALPLLAAGGSWSPCSSGGVWVGAWVWSPAPDLFGD